jgi:WD40 repeat protein
MGQPLRGHTDAVNRLAFNPDGKILASSSMDKTIILWDMTTYQPIGNPLTNTDYLLPIVFSPDGKILASGGHDGVIILWDLSTQSWINKTCQRVGRNFTQAEWSQYFPGESYRTTCSHWPVGE